MSDNVLPLEYFFPEELPESKAEDAKQALKHMLASEGWKIYHSIIASQQTTRFDQIILNPLQSMDQALNQEYMKGEVQGMRTAVTLPQAVIDSIEYQMELNKAHAAAQGDQNAEDE